jgi:hypothetical protein
MVMSNSTPHEIMLRANGAYLLNGILSTAASTSKTEEKNDTHPQTHFRQPFKRMLG